MDKIMTGEQLDQFTGMHSPHSWSDPTALFKARARVSALDESPLRTEALDLIEQALTVTEDVMEHDARRQREAANRAIDRYRTGVTDLATTWADLRTLVEPGWDTEEGDDFS